MMPDQRALLILYLVIALLAFIPEVLYAVRYHLKSGGAWRDHYLGRTIMIKAAVISVLLGFVAFNTTWMIITGGSYALRVPLGMLFFALFAFALWRQWWSFEKIQNDKDKEEKRNEDVR